VNTASSPRVGLVLADLGGDLESALDAATAAVDPGDVVVVVTAVTSAASDQGPLRDGVHVQRVPVPAGYDLGELYQAGLRALLEHNGVDAIGFTGSLTRLAPGWRAGLIAGVSEHGFVGGPVFPETPDAAGGSTASRRNRKSWAGFLVEYAPHAVEPFVSRSGDFSANNVGYRADLIADFAYSPFWKTSVDRRLHSAGHTSAFRDDMVAVSAATYTTRDLTSGRFVAGRRYARDLAPQLPVPILLLRLLGCAALPFIQALRLISECHRSRHLQAALTSAAGWVILALITWSAGEAAGFGQEITRRSSRA
jgi:hypothetical protein